MNTDPEIIIKNAQIDIDLANFLGEKQMDFVVLCFDGVQLDFFGTPYDSPTKRAEYASLAKSLNDKSDDSLWPKMFVGWKYRICQQFKLPPETTSDKYRPVVSWKISRVCPGYSEHLHAAIGLFEKVGDQIKWWSVGKMPDGNSSVIITGKSGKEINMSGEKLSEVIVCAVKAFLTTDKT